MVRQARLDAWETEGSEEFYYLDDRGFKADSGLHGPILRAVDYPILEEIMEPIREKHKAKAKANRKRKRLGDLAPWEEDKHPRGQPKNAGQFGPGGSSSESEQNQGDPAAQAMLATKKPMLRLQPEAVNVGGDEWNRQVAVRLETEYQTAKPALEAMAFGYTKAKDIGEKKPDDEEQIDEEDQDDEDAPISPDEWDYLSADVQQEIEDAYMDKALPDYLDSEIQSWQENGGALDEAKGQLVDDGDWLEEKLSEWTDVSTEDDDETDDVKPAPKYPFEYKDIAEAITIGYLPDGQGTGETTIEWDDSALDSPTGVEKDDPAQMRMPGIEAKDYSKLLTPEMRTEIETMLKDEFEKQASKNADNVEPPDFTDQAKDYMQENWSGGMSDSDKFEWAKYNTGIIKQAQEDYENAVETGKSVSMPDGLPEKFDPLNETSGDNYRKTQKLARAMSIDRATQVMEDRGIKVSPKALGRLDHKLWDAWKGSSTSDDGKLLQVAVAEELGGRLNTATGSGGHVKIDNDQMKAYADKEYSVYGGYKGILAYTRAKWETTQWLLDKAGKHELELYRGLAIEQENYLKAQEAHEVIEGFKKAPNLNVVRNGAASTTVSRDVANNWKKGTPGKITLRAVMPRTAAVSVPAYGINVKSEQEVVVAGTAWKGWDAWLDQAPPLTHVKLKHA